MGERGQAMNRMGWAIALAGAWTLASMAVVGGTDLGGNPQPDCAPGFYLDGAWCVRDPQPTDAPGVGVTPVLVARTAVGPVGIEPTTEGL